jgi:pimeloyl-ACP methyl ester carboxylesterase
MPFLSTSFGDLAYDSRGSGPAIILLPSGAHDRRDFDELRDQLPGRYRSVAIDWPGHGQSAAQPQNDEMQLTRLIREVVQVVAPHGAVLIGHSIGGNVAARLAIRHPELVTGLVLLDAGGFEESRTYSRAFSSLMSRPWFVRMVYPAFSAWYMRANTSADRQARATAVEITRSIAGRTAVSQMWHSFNHPAHDLRADAEKISAPTLIVVGNRDPVIPVSAAQTAHHLIRKSKLLVLDSGHSPHTTNPAPIARELTSLLTLAFAEATEQTDNPSPDQSGL